MHIGAVELEINTDSNNKKIKQLIMAWYVSIPTFLHLVHKLCLCSGLFRHISLAFFCLIHRICFVLEHFRHNKYNRIVTYVICWVLLAALQVLWFILFDYNLYWYRPDLCTRNTDFRPSSFECSWYHLFDCSVNAVDFVIKVYSSNYRYDSCSVQYVMLISNYHSL